MKPILLMGHSRALTKIKFNRDGDLLFSVSKDNQPSVWFSDNGERLGTFDGHGGTVWDLDVSMDSNRLLTGSADNSMRMWAVNGGKELFKWNTKTAVRSVCFAAGDAMACFVTDATMGQPSTLHVVSIANDTNDQTDERLLTIVIKGSKATVAKWGKFNKTIITGHEDGTLTIWNAETGEKELSVKKHHAAITDIQFGHTQDYFITASKDFCAIIFESEDLTVFKKFETERPVNAAAISPLKPHGKFEVRFYHTIFEDEIGRVKGHFGPINTLAFHPSGKGYASGGEDGIAQSA
ncbi:Eukaryotic translation initiation factor 3 subunit I [Kappamyces sp. JEL0829]|nr:Eukaryotic translation initiation factor 3 subunit I [Kappamyces sp. JEL0829]